MAMSSEEKADLRRRVSWLEGEIGMLRLLLAALIRTEGFTQQNVLDVAQTLFNQQREPGILWTLSDSRDKIEFFKGMEYSRERFRNELR